MLVSGAVRRHHASNNKPNFRRFLITLGAHPFMYQMHVHKSLLIGNYNAHPFMCRIDVEKLTYIDNCNAHPLT